jgi:hypothetical protein
MKTSRILYRISLLFWNNNAMNFNAFNLVPAMGIENKEQSSACGAKVGFWFHVTDFQMKPRSKQIDSMSSMRKWRKSQVTQS